jgi:flagellin-like hook-associated protein FlgL
MPITVASNIVSLGVQRQLGKTTEELAGTYSKLSSGLRINSAKDDAAGLAISMGLNVDSRVYSVGVRNLNDGISLFNIAQGALSQLSEIVQRQLELAEQASNGSVSLSQRKAINLEAKALTDEWNRIQQTTKFNGVTLLDGGLDTLSGGMRIQAGYRELGSIASSVGNELNRVINSGSFTLQTSGSSSGTGYSADAGDVNGDGNIDLLVGEGVMLGNGDGTFSAAFSIQLGNNVYGANLIDVNGDGRLDVVASDMQPTNSSIRVALGNGNGTFAAAGSYASGDSTSFLSYGDINRDGFMDIIAPNTGNGSGTSISVLLGNGNGTFRTGTTITGVSVPFSVSVVDIDGDNILDLVSGSYSPGTDVTIFKGNGDGTFRTSSVLTGLTGSSLSTSVADYNNDGNLDILLAGTDGRMLLGNGDGTFRYGQTFSTVTAGSIWNIKAVDLNGDGNLDFIGGKFTSAVVYIGNGDGTFRSQTSIADDHIGIAVADFDKNGTIDIAGSYWNSPDFTIYSGDKDYTTSQGYKNLTTISSARAAVDTFRQDLERVSKELGQVGAQTSRFQVAINVLNTSVESFK